MKQKKRSRQRSGLFVGVAWYRSEDWNRLLTISADRDDLEDTYEEWVASAETHIRGLRAGGVAAEKVLIDLDELEKWCRMSRRPVDAAARSEFTAEKIRTRHELKRGNV